MQTALAIGAGGFCGAIARYYSVRAIAAWAGTGFPVGTLFVNVAGSFGLGLLLGLAATRTVPADLRAGVAVGFCGGFTTMSAFSFETLALIERGAFALAALNATASVLACLAAVWIGLGLGRSL